MFHISSSRYTRYCIVLLTLNLLTLTRAVDINGRVYGRPTKPSSTTTEETSASMPSIVDSSLSTTGSSSSSAASLATFFGGDNIPRIVLNGGEYQTFPLKDGTFRFNDVPAGIYLLEIFHRDLVYSTYKLNVPKGQNNNNNGGEASIIQVNEYKYPGAPKLPGKYPIEAQPVAASLYFEERPRFTIWSLMSGGMMIPMILIVCMMVLPKLVGEDAIKQAQEEQQASIPDFDPNNPFAAFSKILSGDTGEGGNTNNNGESTASSSSNQQPGNRANRRK